MRLPNSHNSIPMSGSRCFINVHGDKISYTQKSLKQKLRNLQK